MVPLSAEWMPAIVFTIVDLPAPLSPTRPTTSPALTAKSTRSNAWTGPNALLTPSSSRSGVPAAISARDSCFFARRRVGAGAEFGSGDEAVGDDRALDVVFDHGDRFEQHRRDFAGAVVEFFGDFVLRHSLAFGEGDGDFGADLRLRADFLVHRHELL